MTTRTVLRSAALAALVAASVLAGWHWPAVESWLRTAGGAGVAPFGVGFAVLAMGCFPVSVLAITAGAVYGPLLGLAVVVPAVAAGGLLMFALGRSVLRGPVRRLVARSARLRVLEDLAADKALRLNVLARLSPFNYGFVCYTLAAGRTPLRAYALGLVGALPSLVVHVAVGSLVRRGAALGGGEGVSWLEVGGTAAAVLAMLGLGWQVGRIAMDAWRRAAVEAQPDASRADGEERSAP